MKEKILLKNGQIITPESVEYKDLLIENGKISKILDKGTKVPKGVKAIDCGGKFILPGLIDAHVHFREPGASYKEDWETGSKAAVSGGVTTVLDMPNNNPPVMTSADLENKRALIGKRSYCNFGLFIGYNGENIEEINKVKNVPGVKVYIANSTGSLGVGVNGLRELFEKTDKKIVVHAEDEGIIEKNSKEFLVEYRGREIDPAVHSKIHSPEAVARAVKAVCEIAKDFPGRLHIAHVSSEEETETIGEHRKYGVTCEVTPHHLTLSEDDYSVLGNFAKVNPAIRDRSEVFALWKSLKFGLIDIIATDHAPHTAEEKRLPYIEAPAGIPEIETILPLFLNTVNDDGMTINELVKYCCVKPAEIFGIKEKGKIAEGYDADLVVIDMELEKYVSNKKLFTKCKWSPYDGIKLKGWPVMTFVSGEIAFKDGEIVGKAEGKEVKFEQ